MRTPDRLRRRTSGRDSARSVTGPGAAGLRRSAPHDSGPQPGEADRLEPGAPGASVAVPDLDAAPGPRGRRRSGRAPGRTPAGRPDRRSRPARRGRRPRRRRRRSCTSIAAAWNAGEKQDRPRRRGTSTAPRSSALEDVERLVGVEPAVHRATGQAEGDRSEAMAADMAALPDPVALLGAGAAAGAPSNRARPCTAQQRSRPLCVQTKQPRSRFDRPEGRQLPGRDAPRGPSRADLAEVGEHAAAQQHAARRRAGDPDVALGGAPARSGRSGCRASRVVTPRALAAARCAPDVGVEVAVEQRIATPGAGLLDDDPRPGRRGRAGQWLGGGERLSTTSQGTAPAPAMGARRRGAGAVPSGIGLGQRRRALPRPWRRVPVRGPPRHRSSRSSPERKRWHRTPPVARPLPGYSANGVTLIVPASVPGRAAALPAIGDHDRGVVGHEGLERHHLGATGQLDAGHARGGPALRAHGAGRRCGAAARRTSRRPVPRPRHPPRAAARRPRRGRRRRAG